MKIDKKERKNEEKITNMHMAAINNKEHIIIIRTMFHFYAYSSYLYQTIIITFFESTGMKKVDITCNKKKNRQRRFLHDKLHGDGYGYQQMQ